MPTQARAETWVMSAARHAYGVHDPAVASEASRAPSNVVPLLLLVIGLAAVSIWFVALPASAQQPAAEQSCEVYVIGKRAVCKPVPGSAAAAPKRTPSAKR